MLTDEKIEELKAKYGDVYEIEINEEPYVFRKLNRQEWKEIRRLQAADDTYREERICEKCVVWPENYDVTKMAAGAAGTPSLLSDNILEKSGFALNAVARKL